MDVIAEVMTTAAVSVTTFRYKQSTIIIFVQNDGNTPGIGSMVYEFEDGTADRIQFLPTSNPTSVHHYSHAGFNFILLVNQHGPSSLYWWDGWFSLFVNILLSLYGSVVNMLGLPFFQDTNC